MLRGSPPSLGSELTSVKRMMESTRPVRRKKEAAEDEDENEASPNFGGPRQRIEKQSFRQAQASTEGGPGSGPQGGGGGSKKSAIKAAEQHFRKNFNKAYSNPNLTEKSVNRLDKKFVSDVKSKFGLSNHEARMVLQKLD